MLPLLLAPKPVTFPAGAYTYPEIAARLSEPGHRVELARTLGQRGAVVALRSRPREEALRIVARALDLEVTVPSEGRVLLVPNRAVARRETRWRLAVTAALTGQIADVAARVRAVRPTLKGLSNDERHALLASDADALDAGAEPTPETREAYARAVALDRAVAADESPLYSLGYEIALRTGLTDLAEAPDTWVWSDARGLPPDMARPVRAVMKADAGTPLGLLSGYTVDRREGQLAIWPAGFITPPDAFAVPLPGLLIANLGGFPPRGDRPTILDELFFGRRTLDHPPVDLGPEARALAAAQEAATARVLAESGAGERIALPKSVPDSSLSLLFEAWLRAGDREGIMPLSPVADDRATDAARAEVSLRRLFAGPTLWALAREEGVLVARNRLGFVDDAFGYPVAEAIAQERFLAAEPPVERASSGAVPLDAVQRAIARLREGGSGWARRGAPGIAEFRGVPVYTVETAAFVLAALELARPGGLRGLDQRLGRGDARRRYGLAGLSPDDLLALARVGRSLTGLETLSLPTYRERVLRAQTVTTLRRGPYLDVALEPAPGVSGLSAARFARVRLPAD